MPTELLVSSTPRTVLGVYIDLNVSLLILITTISTLDIYIHGVPLPFAPTAIRQSNYVFVASAVLAGNLKSFPSLSTDQHNETS